MARRLRPVVAEVTAVRVRCVRLCAAYIVSCCVVLVRAAFVRARDHTDHLSSTSVPDA